MNRAYASLLIFLILGCQTPRPVAVEPAARETETPAEIERKLRVVRDAAVEKYLESMITKLRDPTPEALRARVFRATTPADGISSVKSGALFVSLHALQACRFENEAAAIIALGLENGSAELAIDRLYQAGIDPRGVVAVAERQKADAQKISDARARIAIYPPLRNPVVSTEAFSAMMRRLKQLR